MKSLIVVLGLLGGLLVAGAQMKTSAADAPDPLVDIVMGKVIVTDTSKMSAYDTLEEAAVHAAQRLYTCSQYYECSGIIAKRESDGKFINGPVRSDYSGDSVQVNNGHPVGTEVTASIHSHPCHEETHYDTFFSPEDLMGFITHKQIGFMVDFCTGDVHEFDPAKDSPAETELPNDEGTFATHGRIVGHIVVSKFVVEPNQGF